jgi:hypothetical protein
MEWMESEGSGMFQADLTDIRSMLMVTNRKDLKLTVLMF